MNGYRPGMLDDLEAGPGIGLSAPVGLTPPPPGLTIPTIPPTTAPPTPAPARQKRATRTKKTAPAAEPAKAAAAAPVVDVEPPRRKRRGRPPLPPDSRPQTRPTNVMIPTSTFARVAKAREELAMSTGEIIVVAVEAQLKRLPGLLATPRTGMFETRATRLPHRADEPERPLSYRLTGNDLATIDNLVDKYGARSRGHLIAVALNAHFEDN